MNSKNPRTIRTLLLKSGKAARIINLITIYRIVTFPLLIVLALTDQFQVFKWLLLASFSTDAIDGYLARKYNATSILGAKLDSIGDDLTILAGIVGVCVLHLEFIKDHLTLLSVVAGLFLIQVTYSLSKYGKITSFHTYLAKTAAVITGVFLVSVFFLESILYPLFLASCFSIAIELTEEIILVYKLPRWQANVKGLYWLTRKHA